MLRKKVYYIDNISPPSVVTDEVNHFSIGYPPLYRPKGKRVSINPSSQYFTLAIPNSKDMTGRAEDLQKSLADMLYTQIFQTRRFNLYDRDELKNIDTEWLEKALKESFVTPKNNNLIEYRNNFDEQTNTEVLQRAGDREFLNDSVRVVIEEKKNAGLTQPTAVGEYVNESLKFISEKQRSNTALVQELRTHSDGLLMSYITSRIGGQSGGFFDLDYRIVSPNPERRVVLFAGSKKFIILLPVIMKLPITGMIFSPLPMIFIRYFRTRMLSEKGRWFPFMVPAL